MPKIFKALGENADDLLLRKAAKWGDEAASAATKRADDVAESAAKKSTKITDPRYARPSGFRKGVRDDAWNNAVEPRTGRVRDPVTGRFMSKDQAWDMGHKPGYEFRKHQESAMERGISREEFLDEYNKSEHYRPELPSSNRGHRGEDDTDLYLGD